MDQLLALLMAMFRDEFKKIAVETLVETKPESKETPKRKYSTRKQTSERLNVSLVTLNRLNKEGILPACKIGGRVLYLDETVDKAVEEGQIKYRRSKNSSYYR